MRGAIDIGSNSMLLTIVDDEGQVLHDQCDVVSLGRGLGDGGAFLDDRMDAARAVFVAYAATARRLGLDPAEIRAIGTSASRRATNATAFYDAITAETGIRVSIIGGDEEARLTWLGARQGLTLPDDPVLVVDLGGGSTELALGRTDIARRQSLELGSVRLTETFGLDRDVLTPEDLVPVRQAVRAQLETFAFDPRPVEAIGVAGTVTTLLALDLGLTSYDSARIHDGQLTRGAIRALLALFASSPLAMRRDLCAISPKRAQYLIAGMVVLDTLLSHTGLSALRVSDRGIRFGALADQ